MFQSVTLYRGSVRLQVLAKKIACLFFFYSEHFTLNIAGVCSAHSQLYRVIVSLDDTHWYITLGRSPVDVWSARYRTST